MLHLIALVVVTVLVQEEVRTWRDISGSFSTRATLVVSADDELTADVQLVKESGEKISVPLKKLDASSQRYVRRVRKEAKEQPADSNVSSNQNVWNWRGPKADGISSDTGLISDWQSSEPELMWTADGMGKGMSSVCVADGKIYTVGNVGGTLKLTAVSLVDGSALWSSSVGGGGDPNSTPTYHDGMIYTLGKEGDLACASAEDGSVVWSKNFQRDFGGKMMSQWGYSESPLVDDNKLICTPGGARAMMVALNLKTGEPIWSAPMSPGGQRGKDGAGYATPVVSNGGGVKQYITLVGRGLISVEAKTGRPLWQYEKIANNTANVPTPIVDGDFVFCSSGYGDGGTALLQLSGRRGAVNWREVYYQDAKQLQNHHGGMIKIGNYVYMGEGHNEGFPMCVDFRTGRKMWGKQRGAGTGSAAIVAADGHLYFRYQNGVMALIEADPKGYKLKGSFQIASRNGQSWPHPVVIDGKLLLRDQNQLHCYSLKSE